MALHNAWTAGMNYYQRFVGGRGYESIKGWSEAVLYGFHSYNEDSSLVNMMGLKKFAALTGLLAVSHASTYCAPENPASACSALASSIAIQNVTVNFAQYIPAGTNLTLTQGMRHPYSGHHQC